MQLEKNKQILSYQTVDLHRGQQQKIQLEMIFKNQIFKIFKFYNYKLVAFVVLISHVHLFDEGG